MCGIAGILSTYGYGNNLETLVQRMQIALRHRGPNDQGIYISEDNTVAFAHTRLSILDLSQAGHQPMSAANGRYWISFNGEIYNFRELRTSLQSQGEKFYSQTDTEVILKLYEKFGAECVQYLRGMFAFAIWDNLEKSCFIARDPLGIKPLYYWQSGNTLLFASETKAILATKLLEVNLSLEGLYGYLVYGSVPEPYTMIQGVKCLEAGHYFHWKSGNFSQHQYWKINFGSERIQFSEAKEKVRTALIDSINHHFISDVPVGIFLSGGIDSSAVLALARQVQQGELRTYSIAFEENEWNEGDIARKVADNFGTNHTEHKITAASGKSLFTQFIKAIDQPSIDGFNTFCVSQIAQQNGTKVVLSGLGGDELFAGYKSFQEVPRMVQIGKRLDYVKPLTIAVGKALECWSKSGRVKRLGDFLQQPTNSATAYRSFRGIFSHWEACKIAAHYIPDSKIYREKTTKQLAIDLPSIEDEVSFLEISEYMRNQLLRDSDVMSMAWGLELRVPLVDRVLLETIASIPSQIRLASGKQLLIQAVPELPDWVANRSKKGFMFPFEKWITGEWRDYFSDVDVYKNISLTPWYRRWSIAILQHWWEQVRTI